MRLFCSLGAARVSFPHGLHFGCCIYLHHTRFGSGTALLYTSDRHLTQIHAMCLFVDKECVPSHNTNNRPYWPEHKCFFFDSPPMLVAFLFLRLVTISYSSTVTVASNFFISIRPIPTSAVTVVLPELPFFSVPKWRYTCYATPRIL